MSIKIVTDSTSDMPTEVAKALGVIVVPGYVHFGYEVYQDGVDINNKAFYQKLITSPFHPTTSEPTPEDFSRVYFDCSQEAEGVVSIHVSTKISDTCKSAMKAKKQVRDKYQIEVVDSGLISAGLSLVVMKAAKLANRGESIQSILERATNDISKIRMLGILNTMKYLVRSGRVIKIKSPLSRMTQIKPVLTFKNGEIIQESLVHADSYSHLINRLYEFVKDNTIVRDLAIAHSVTPDQEEELMNRLGDIFPKEEIHIAQIGAAIGVHGGPGALVVALRQDI
jgi:DegV family protein with EDD domain